MGLSKAFDSTNHEVLVVKLEACGFLGICSQIMRSYMEKRKKRFKVKVGFSNGETIFTQGLQSSILGPHYLTFS